MDKPQYHRLPGRHVGWFARDSLWCAEDHLLWVRNIGFVERYRRYYFKDLQALTITPTGRARNLTIGLSVPIAVALFMALLSAAGHVHVGWAIAFATVATPCLVALIMNLVRGPTCVARLYTAVSDVVLPSLGRRHAALRAASLIAGFVNIEQGAVDPAKLGYGDAETTSLGPARKHLDAKARRAAVDDGALSKEQDRAASLGLLVQGGCELLFAAGAALVMGVPAFRFGLTLFFFSLVLVLIVSSVLLARLASGKRWPAMLCMVHGLLVGIASYVAVYAAIFRAAASSPDPQVYAGLDAFSPAFAHVLWVLWFALIGALALAATNFLSSLRRGGQN
jgi:hypothetical protein